MPRHFAWQAWRLVTSTFALCGRRGAWSHPSSFCMAGMALGHIHVAGVALMAVGWLWWRAWVGFKSPVTPRHSAWQAWHPSSSCVPDVAFGDIDLRFAWQAWHLMALGWLWWRAWAGLVAGDAAALCVAGVALGDIHLCFGWQAWRLVTCIFVLRGRRGTWSHPSFCMAGVALMALGWLWWRASAGFSRR